jgi:NADPH:quinone reductase-like Zn-dependent oxidoreductase
MRAIRVHAKAETAIALPATVRLEDAATPAPSQFQVLIEVHASGVNPSDGKAILGAMPHAVWPRTPGRDFAGIVVDGPADLIGQAVWGSGGELGIRRDGAHATHLLLDAHDVRPKPATLSLHQAGAIGVPFITAWQGLHEAGSVKPTDIVLIAGVNGKVGQAAAQLATAAGARVFGVARHAAPFRGVALQGAPITMLAAEDDWATHLRDATGGHGADIVYNTAGSPYFIAACHAMAIEARQIFISTLDRAVPFDIFAFYRGRHRFIGIDTLALTSGDCAAMLDAMRPGFESGQLRPFPTHAYRLDQAAEAYQAVLGGATERVILTPAD